MKDCRGGNSRRSLEIRGVFGNNFADWCFSLRKGFTFRKSGTLSKIVLPNKSFTLGKNGLVRLIVLNRFGC